MYNFFARGHYIEYKTEGRGHYTKRGKFGSPEGSEKHESEARGLFTARGAAEFHEVCIMAEDPRFYTV